MTRDLRRCREPTSDKVPSCWKRIWHANVDGGETPQGATQVIQATVGIPCSNVLERTSNYALCGLIRRLLRLGVSAKLAFFLEICPMDTESRLPPLHTNSTSISRNLHGLLARQRTILILIRYRSLILPILAKRVIARCLNRNRGGANLPL